MSKKRPLYGLVYGIPEQKAIIDKHCFGTCKKIICGAITDNVIGTMFPCRTPASQCPQFDKETEEPVGEVLGDPLFIRKLRKTERKLK